MLSCSEGSSALSLETHSGMFIFHTTTLHGRRVRIAGFVALFGASYLRSAQDTIRFSNFTSRFNLASWVFSVLHSV
jgi:hypothetical protein